MSASERWKDLTRITLYHGSERIIRRPSREAGQLNNDYGRGFYCTEHRELAAEWSVRRNTDGFINRYSLELGGLQILDLGCGEYTILHWLAILLENREFSLGSALAKEGKRYLTERFALPYGSADLIVGYRADDSYFSFAEDFLNGTISLRQLEEAMYLGELGEQVMLQSERAFAQLRFEDHELTDKRAVYPRFRERDMAARAAYRAMDKVGWRRGEIYLPAILDQEMEADDARIQRVVY